MNSRKGLKKLKPTDISYKETIGLNRKKSTFFHATHDIRTWKSVFDEQLTKKWAGEKIFINFLILTGRVTVVFFSTRPRLATNWNSLVRRGTIGARVKEN